MDVNGKKVKLSIWVCQFRTITWRIPSPPDSFSYLIFVYRTQLGKRDSELSLPHITVEHKESSSYTMSPIENHSTLSLGGIRNLRHMFQVRW